MTTVQHVRWFAAVILFCIGAGLVEWIAAHWIALLLTGAITGAALTGAALLYRHLRKERRRLTGRSAGAPASAPVPPIYERRS